MTLSEFCIRRPVFAVMINLALILFGVIALTRLPVRELPDIDPPIINVNTVYPGASAEVVETEITEKLEEVINTVEGIKKLTSESREQVSSITIEFDLSRDIDIAAQDVRDRVSRARGNLPDEVDEPIIAKQDGDAQPFMWIAIYSDVLDTLELTDLAENVLKDPLQTVAGVSSVIIGGEKRFSIRLWLDEQKMAARGITIQDVDQVLQTQNLELPSGRVENRQRELSIQILGELRTVDEFNRLVIRDDPNDVVRLEDIGRAEIGPEDTRSLARYNSQPAVGLGIIKQSKSNTIEVANGIKTEIELLGRQLPSTVNYFVAYDESVFVEQSVKEVWTTLAVAFFLVVLTIFVFLRDVRSTIVPCIAIPVAITSTFLILFLFDFSINIITLMALVLVIGVVVDDAIVVLENIYRHIENGEHPMEAAIKGMREIIFAIIVTTISLVVVFLPMAFQQSQTGRLFIEFAITMAGAVIVSSFVALTLSPVIASRILKSHTNRKHGVVFNFFERTITGLTNLYMKSLHVALRFKWTMVVLALFVSWLGYFFITQLDREFMPDEDKGRFFSFIMAPEGSTPEYTDRMVSQAEEILAETEEVEGYFTAVGLGQGGPGAASTGLAFVRYKDRDQRARSVQDTMAGPDGISARFFGEVEGAMAFAILPKSIGGGFSQPFQLVIQSNDLPALDNYTQQLVNRLRAENNLQGLRANFELNKPELRILIDRDRAAALGVTVESISRTLQVLYGGLDVSKFKRGGKEYDVIAQLERDSRLTPQSIEGLYIRNRDGELVQLINVVNMEEGGGPNAVYRFNRLRSATIEGTPMIPLGNLVEQVEGIIAETLPAGFRYEWSGEVENLQETGADFMLVLILAIVVLYMVLASQFESLIHPITVMVAIPLSLVGAFGALWLLSLVNAQGEMLYAAANYAPPGAVPDWVLTLQKFVPRIPAMNLNLYSQIGMLLLIALVTKNGILLVEFALQEIERGKNAFDAIVSAGRIRFRPILMTSFSTIAGILPIAIGFGAGAESRRPLGVVAVGGLTVSTILALIMVPVVFLIFGRFAKKRGEIEEKIKHDKAKEQAMANEI